MKVPGYVLLFTIHFSCNQICRSSFAEFQEDKDFVVPTEFVASHGELTGMHPLFVLVQLLSGCNIVNEGLGRQDA